jgi:hypothetical protein
LRLIPGSFIDDVLKERVTDLLFEVPFPGGDSYVHLLYEHTSTIDQDMPLSVLDSQCRIWLWHRREKGQPGGLPPILTIVLYNGERPWTAPLHLRGMIAFPEDAPLSLEALQSEAAYILIDLSKMPVAELLDRARRCTPLAAVTAVVLKRSAAGELFQRLVRIVDLVRQLRDPVRGWWALRPVVRYILDVYTDVSIERLAEFMEQHLDSEARKVVMTTGEKLRREGEALGLAKGEARGLVKGEAAGLAKGLAEGLRQALLKILRRRFGDLPETVSERIRTADAETLRLGLDQTLDAAVIDDVFKS